MARKRTRVKKKHIIAARSTKYEMPASFYEGKSAKDIYEEGMEEIRRMGYRVVQRRIIKPTTTMPITLYLGKNFPGYPMPVKAAIVRHELVHADQWRDPQAVFPLRYPARRWQWVFETQGYREQCRVIRALAGDKAARKFAYWVASRLRKKPYTMRRLDARHVRLITLRAFEQGLPGLKLL